MPPEKPTIVFAYNAGSGLFNALTDAAHKVLSPRTYACNLCALTYGPLGMREQWKHFIESLDRPVQFLHRDELAERYGVEDVELPAVFLARGEHDPDPGADPWIDAGAINACASIEALESLIRDRLAGA